MELIESKKVEKLADPLLENITDDDDDDDKSKKNSARLSIIIVGIVTFVGDATRGILNPVLWPLCKVLV
jgi:hypothetical protein